MAETERRRFSSDVKLDLLMGDQQIDLSHTGPDFFIAKEPLNCEPGTPAIVVITVNGERREHAVVLPGSFEAGREVYYSEPDADAGKVVVIHFKPGEPVTRTVRIREVIQVGNVRMKVVRSLGGRRMEIEFEEQA